MAENKSSTLVLVTGGSGFVGGWCVAKALEAGYSVRTTVRSPKKQDAVKEAVKEAGIKDFDKLSFAVADLESDDGWDDAVKGCTYVLHTASPFPLQNPKHEDELIKPARDGTLRVLKAAVKAGVKRAVVTSSVAAVGYGHPPEKTSFDESDWTNINDKTISFYAKSKTIAEKAAWDYVKDQQIELVEINAVGIFGPILSTSLSSSIELVKRMMTGKMPVMPQISFGIVDVRDVADIHILAMTSDKAAGQRFITSAVPTVTMQWIAETLKDKTPNISQKVTTRTAPNFLLKLVAPFNKEVASISSQLGKPLTLNNEKAVTYLGWKPRSREEAVISTAESLKKFNLV